MELFFIVLVAGMASAMVVGFISELLESFISSKLLRIVLTLPSSLLASWLLGLGENTLIVSTLAAGFFSAVLLTLVSRAATVTNVINRR